jgi:hypothetical protein
MSRDKARMIMTGFVEKRAERPTIEMYEPIDSIKKADIKTKVANNILKPNVNGN